MSPPSRLLKESADSRSVPSGGISTFGPLIIQAFGFDSFQTILFNMPFGALQLFAVLGGGWLATKIKMKGPVIILLCLMPIAGCIGLLSIDHVAANKSVLLGVYYLVSQPGFS